MTGNESTLRASFRQALGPAGWVLSVVAVLIGLFLLIPILIIFPISLTSDFLLTWPPHLFSLRWFEAFFDSGDWTDALLRSIRIAVPVALVATTIGTLSALGLAYARRGGRALRTLFIAPMVLPIITYALGLYDVSQRFGMTGSALPVIVGQAMLATPIVFIVVSAALATRDPLLPQAAASLGAPGWAVLLRIELPLLRPSIAAGALVALAYSFDEIIVAYFLSPPGAGTLPVEILGSTRETADPTIAAASMVVIGIVASIAALSLLVSVFLRRRSR